jgi:polynucleotide 5'-hydroxyl-kinase GRC3/NOL9
MDIPFGWKDSAARILENRWRKILVLGATDCGKSTYCRFLCTTLCGAGFPVAFVDGDVGQKDVGTPATISLAVLEGEGDVFSCQPERLYFVGGTSPLGRMLPMIVGMRKMLDAADTAFVVVNTTGLVHGPGRVLKTYQIDAIQPDVIVCIEHGGELEPLIRSHGTYNIFRIKASSRAMAKSRQERIAAREESFRAYFQNAEERNLNMSDLVFQRFSAPDQPGGEREEGADATAIDLERKREVSREEKAGFPLETHRNLLCGVLNAENEVLGLALLQEIDVGKEMISLLTPVEPEKIKIIQGGDLYLHRDGRELAIRRDP